MDIRTTPPAEYVSWLRRCGVAEQDIKERLAHDMLRAMTQQMDGQGVPAGFEKLQSGADQVLAEDAMRRILT